MEIKELSLAYPNDRCKSKEGFVRSYNSAPSIISQECRWSINSEYHLSGMTLVNKDTFVNEDPSAFGRAFPLFQDNPVTQPKKKSYAQPQG